MTYPVHEQMHGCGGVMLMNSSIFSDNKITKSRSSDFKINLKFKNILLENKDSKTSIEKYYLFLQENFKSCRKTYKILYDVFIKNKLLNYLDICELSTEHLKEEFLKKELQDRIVSGATNKISISKHQKSELMFFKLQKLLSINLAFDDSTNTLYFLKKNEWVIFEREDYEYKESFKYMISLILGEYANTSRLDSWVKSLLVAIRMRSTNSMVYQFKDCYLDGNTQKFTVGHCVHCLPRAKVDIAIKDCLINNKPTVVVPEVDDLLNHISENDNVTREWLLIIMSLVFLLNTEAKIKFSRIIRITGLVGGNGKSTLFKLWSRAVGEENVMAMSITDLSNYALEKAIRYPLIVDGDSDGTYLKGKLTGNLKKLAFFEELQVRAIYGEPYKVKPISQIAIASNFDLASEDKSDGLHRRFANIKVDNVLKRDDKWFTKIRSTEAKVYMCQLLVLKLSEILRGEITNLPTPSDKMRDYIERTIEDNDSTRAFIRDKGRTWFVGRAMKEVTEQYESFCELNELTVQGTKKMKNSIMAHLGLDLRRISPNDLSLDSALEYKELSMTHGDNIKITAWVEKK